MESLSAISYLHLSLSQVGSRHVLHFLIPDHKFAGLNAPDQPDTKDMISVDVPYRVKFDFLAPTMKAVTGFNPVTVTVNPTKTYDGAIEEGIQYDILWVPAGKLPGNEDPWRDTDYLLGPIPDLKSDKIEVAPPSEIDFIKAQAPKAKYVLSVCGGSGVLAQAGVLSGKRATTNKAFFRVVEVGCRRLSLIWTLSSDRGA